MEKKKIIFIIIGIILVLLVGVGLIYHFNKDEEKVDTDVSYAISFKKTDGNSTYYTYFYVYDDRYYYVQATSTSAEDESGTYVNKITDSSYFYNPVDIVEIAGSNKSLDIITINVEINDYSKGDVITVEELEELLSEMEIYKE